MNAAPYLARVCASRGNAIGCGLALWLAARRHQFIHSARRIFSRSLSASPSVAFITGRVHSSRRTSRIERMRRWIHDHGCCEARSLTAGLAERTWTSSPCSPGFSLRSARRAAPRTSATNHDLVHDGPPGTLEVQAVRVISGRLAARLGSPRGFHRHAVVKPHLDNDVPRRMTLVVWFDKIL